MTCPFDVDVMSRMCDICDTCHPLRKDGGRRRCCGVTGATRGEMKWDRGDVPCPFQPSGNPFHEGHARAPPRGILDSLVRDMGYGQRLKMYTLV